MSSVARPTKQNEVAVARPITARQTIPAARPVLDLLRLDERANTPAPMMAEGAAAMGR